MAKYAARGNPPSQGWKTFLKNHSHEIVSVDFFTVPTVSCQILYVFLMIENSTRRIVHFNVTAHPTMEWTSRQLVEAFPWNTAPTYILRDRDSTYGRVFKAMVEAQGGDPAAVDDLSKLPSASIAEELTAEADGFVTQMDCLGVGVAAMHLGAGRAVAEDSVDHAVGLVLHKKIGDPVAVGESLVTIHANEVHRVDSAKNDLRAAIQIGPERPDSRPLIIEII